MKKVQIYALEDDKHCNSQKHFGGLAATALIMATQL